MLTSRQLGHGIPGKSIIGIRVSNVARHFPQVIDHFGPLPKICMTEKL